MTVIRKAIFPVAGLGTRFLPATKANPKEMLPIVDKPLIQYAVEEAISAGVTQLIFVTSSSKRAIEDHFDTSYELESKLEERGKFDVLATVRNILPEGVSCVYVRQHNPLGLGHAILCARDVVGDEPCAVLLADDLIESTGTSCLAQMVARFKELGTSLIAVEEVPREDTEKYGVVELTKPGSTQIKSIIEKPKPEHAPSTLAAVGRYILTPRIFSLLSGIQPGRGNEIQLTDAISSLLQYEAVHTHTLSGKRYDCGSHMGYLQATIAYALRHPQIGKTFKTYLQEFVEEIA